MDKFTTIPVLPNYEITQNGVIRDKRNLRIKGQYVGSTGYYMVSVSQHNRTKPYRVHRLLAQTFIANPSDLPEVNHKDGNKLNNALDNLEWVTHKQNMTHAFATNLANNTGERNGQSQLNSEQVKQIKQMLGKIPQRLIAERFKVSRTCVSGISTGRLWRHV